MLRAGCLVKCCVAVACVIAATGGFRPWLLLTWRLPGYCKRERLRWLLLCGGCSGYCCVVPVLPGYCCVRTVDLVIAVWRLPGYCCVAVALVVAV